MGPLASSVTPFGRRLQLAFDSSLARNFRITICNVMQNTSDFFHGERPKNNDQDHLFRGTEAGDYW